MGYREFVDKKGNLWKAWDVTPDQRIFLKRKTPASGTANRAERSEAAGLAASDVTPSRERGWLSFQSPEENRRLSPIPAEWENCSEAEMLAYLEKASQVRNRYKA